uniref:DNA-directed RNA polymerase subunit alpha n=4 Tax=Cephalotaxus TaxID=50178 RepID=A0A2P1AEN7_9CONI|nr:RNA polymerase alpha chain [Cephalotaxus sinensis]YP_009641638.1 RNA polymerase alpha chain [Cephalotaxus hainanensis]YP_010138046.1 RNA polymerase alpha subunit [Cephalotaxus griffithii]YP_010138292.1 RNA polymerase alpha subunit [Cephalotaxus harringtonia var. nana]UPV71550.1 RNA polymerase alpha subunit [Cephalotaxus fortunei var. alpina]AVI15495.1 RNA polymerase alpha chain [Cephalotaxus sinensis]AXI98095.1 RNA polymerase alpha chain [Cephalotaxus sinensis]QBZ37775.1 RNA polymerase al
MIQDEISVSIKIKKPQLKCVEFRVDSKRLHYGRFTLSPLRKGQANTIGSAIRRVLLGEVEGTCITRAKLQNIKHEYSVIIGIEESVHEILMNLKKIVLRSDVYGMREGSIHIVGPKKVTAQDIILPPSVRIIDNTQHIASINKSITLDISLEIEKGRGYIIQNPNNSQDGIFPIDAAFIPVQNVNYSIHSYWSENEIQEILFLEIWTNGGVTPKEALYEASRNLIDFFLPFLRSEEENIDGTNSISDNRTFSLPLSHISTDTKIIFSNQIYIDQLNFSTRIYNCLKKANIHTLSDLSNYSREDLMKIKHLGEQSVKEILEFIRNIGIDSPGNRV